MSNTIKNISTSVAVFGLVLSVANNSSIVVDGNYDISNCKLSANVFDGCDNSSITGYKFNNIYIDNGTTRLERIAKESFGEMRDATKEELEGVNQYINSISKSTGIDFFAEC